MAGTTLVLGGTGKTGRRIAERLAARGRAVRVGSRRGEVPFDWNDRQTWEPALAGIEAVYLCYAPDLAVPGAAETVASFAQLAVASGARRLVLLSGRGEEGAHQAEEVVAASGAACTILRSSWFAQNFSEGPFAELVQAGEVALPAGQVPEPFIDVEDIAEVAVAALTEERHAGQVYELTGPRLLTFAEAVDEIARALEREVAYTEVPVEAWRASLLGFGVPEEEVELLAYLFTEVLDGRNAKIEDGVQRALGRAPRDFREFARAAASTGVWGSPQRTQTTGSDLASRPSTSRMQ